MSLRLTYGARGAEPGDPVFIFLNITSWVLITLGLTPALLGGVLSVFGNIIVLLAISAFVEAVIQKRSAQRRSMCRILSLLVERGAQLEPAVFIAGQSITGKVGRAAKGLFKALDSGMPITAAVQRHPKALPAEAAAFLAAGTSKAARQSALHELSRGENSELSAIWRTCIDRFSYLAAVMVFMMAAFAFIMIKIVPEYVKIFDEFDLQLPAMTEAAVGASLFITRYLLAPIIFAITTCMLAAAIVCICYLVDVNPLKWFTDRLFRGRQIADVLRILAIATEHHQPLNDVLNRLAIVYPTTWMRRRIMVAATQVEAGADWRDALRNARIITKAEQSLLKTAEQVGNLPWALRQVAHRREKLAVYWLAARLQVLYPLIIILLGAFVGFYAISLFLPIVQLVHGLSR